jgi:hypothetical protein
MFCTVVCSADTASAVMLIAPASAVKFAFTSAAFAREPALNVFGIVTVSGGAASDTLVEAIVSAAAAAAARCELRMVSFIL